TRPCPQASQVRAQPGHLRLDRQAAPRERPELGTARRRQVRPPRPRLVGLYGTGAADGDLPEAPQVQFLAVHAARGAVGPHEDLHHGPTSGTCWPLLPPALPPPRRTL